MSEVLSMKDELGETRVLAEDEDCSGSRNAINNNNYKTSREDDVTVAEAERSEWRQGCEDAEIQSEMERNVKDTETSENESTADNLSTLSSSASDLRSDSSLIATPPRVGPKNRPLTFSIERIMAAGNCDVSGRLASDDVITGHLQSCRETVEQRGHSRHWPQTEIPNAAAAAFQRHKLDAPAPGNWLSRLQQQTTEMQQFASEFRRRRQAVVDWRPASSLSTLVSRVSPLLFYRHLQSSLFGSWLDAARYPSLVASSSGSVSRIHHQQRQQQQHQHAAAMNVRPAWRPDVALRHSAHSSVTTAKKRDSDGGRQSFTTAGDWSGNRRATEALKFTASGALDLSRCASTVEHHPQSTTCGSALETTSSKEKQQSESQLWVPMADLQSSLENIVSRDVERPIKQMISCRVCGRTFNAHYNLTRHMPVHTGARPFICKVFTARLLIRLLHRYYECSDFL